MSLFRHPAVFLSVIERLFTHSAPAWVESVADRFKKVSRFTIEIQSVKLISIPI